MKSKSSSPLIIVASNEEGMNEELANMLLPWSSLIVSATEKAIIDPISRYHSVRLMIILEYQTDDKALLLLERIKAVDERLAVLIISAIPTIQNATEAIRHGAEDFIAIPFSTELLRKEVARILEMANLRDSMQEMKRQLNAAYGFEQIISNSTCMRSVFERSLAASRSETPVLITGETGTGKELLARAIHNNSRRQDYPFVAINCAAMPGELIESELFGHRKGSFSGAHTDHRGLFSAAHSGTLLLDEISEMAIDIQAKLLRVLQNREVRPVGSLESQLVNVRVIAATNRSIKDLRQRILRPDLFFRLSVLVIEIPPLRARIDDLPLLIKYFFARHCNKEEYKLSAIEPEALDLLANYSFPGNIRELENFVQSLVATLDPEQKSIKPKDVRSWMHRQGLRQFVSEGTEEPPLNLRELEIWAISTALQRTKGNKSRAAALIGISRDSLYRKLQSMERDIADKKVVIFSDNRNKIK